MATKVRVNGQSYIRFKKVDLVQGLDTFAGEVRLIVSQAPNNSPSIKMGDKIEVFFDDVQKLTGYAEKITDSESTGAHDLSFRARDLVADLIDSSVPDSVKFLEGVTTFKELVQLCIDGLGLTNDISITDTVNASFGDSAQPKASRTGQTVGSFLQDNARIVQVFLNTDGEGNVLIQKPSGKLQTIIQNIPGALNNNVTSSALNVDYSMRFNKYIVHSNSSVSGDTLDLTAIGNKGEAEDTEIRSSRVHEQVALTPMSDAECKAAAEEEANIRRARSFAYNCTIAGFSANGELWEAGKEVSVKDDSKGVQGKFQINKVTYSSAMQTGEIVKLDITFPDKLTVQANASAATARTTLPGNSYIVQEGDNLWQIAIDNSISLDSLVAANPQIENPSLIQPDQSIIIPSGGTS